MAVKKGWQRSIKSLINYLRSLFMEFLKNRQGLKNNKFSKEQPKNDESKHPHIE
jgi:hypothetical protein